MNEIGEGILFLIELLVGVFHVITMTLNALIDGVRSGIVFGAVDTDDYPLPFLKDEERAIFEHRYKLIREYVAEHYPDYTIFQKRGDKGRIFANIARACLCSEKTVRRYVLRFLQGGGSKASILDQRYVQSLKPGYDSRKGKVRGKKGRKGSSQVLNDDTLERQFEEAWRRLRKMVESVKFDSNSKFRTTLIQVYNDIIQKYYSVYNYKTGKLELLPPDQRPSYARFYYWVRKYKLHGDKIRRNTVSERDKINNHRILEGNSLYGLFRPLEMVEIDETETSFILRSRLFPDNVVGHCVTYIAIDVLTRRIIGFSCHFHNNSYEGLLGLFDSMMMSDADNAAMIDAQYTTEVFPGRVLPDQIRVDHGSEYVSNDLKENLTGGSKRGTLEGCPVDINLAPVAI